MFIIGLAILALLSFMWFRKKKREIAEEEGDYK
jgi:LPXTG-motif cell wall-anchored protein